MGVLELISKGFVFFDGALGTQLQGYGIAQGEASESWNKTHPEIITKIHRDYFEAGANIATANTFGANPLKIENVDEIVALAIANAKKAMTGNNQFVALDIGPTGKLLKPLGDLDFEDAVSAFAETVRAGARAGADLILIETMSDPYEMKAAVLAAKENSDLPIFATFVLDENGKTVTGADIFAMVAMLEGLGVSALGVNCSLGAEQLKKYIPAIIKASSCPVIVNPNAGMPAISDGKTYYKQHANDFAAHMKEIADMGARILGGCCGTTPEHIASAAAKVKNMIAIPPVRKSISAVASARGWHLWNSSKPITVIGERINPTGKKSLQAELRNGSLDTVRRFAREQEKAGAAVLDINMGLAGIDEKSMMLQAVDAVSAVTSLPLCIDSGSPEVMEAALRHYPGRALVNSVTAEKSRLEGTLKAAAKYGAMIIILPVAEEGIPATTAERCECIKKIFAEAEKYGYTKDDIIVDALTMTVSADPMAALTTLDTVEWAAKEYGCHVLLGLSNVSFGMPDRECLNAAMLTIRNCVRL